MLFKNISYLDLWQLICSPERNFSRGYHDEQFCEIILNLTVFQEEMSFKISYLDLWRPSCSAERSHLRNFVEGIMGNIHLKLF